MPSSHSTARAQPFEKQRRPPRPPVPELQREQSPRAPRAIHRDAVEALHPERLAQAKTAFTCRRVPSSDLHTLITEGAPRPGDLVLARVVRKRQHPRIELPSGRKASLFVGDEVVVSYGNRYASDQFEGIVPDDLAPCHLVASGGVAARAVQRSRLVRPATEIEPIGLLGNAAGVPVNLASYALEPVASDRHPVCLAVIGSSMNAGKTTSAARLVRAFRDAGQGVGAAKITGTGSGGDYWKLTDAGARPVLDFTDAGHVSTYKVPVPELCRVAESLVTTIAAAGCDVIVLEIADGVFQRETAGLLCSPSLQRLVDGFLLAVTDSMSAAAGVSWLERQRLPLLALCGTLTRSPLAAQEAIDATGVPVLGLRELGSADVARCLLAGAQSDSGRSDSGQSDGGQRWHTR